MLLENGEEACSCIKKDCSRHGDCTACLAYHRSRKRPAYCKRGAGSTKGSVRGHASNPGRPGEQLQESN